MSKAIFFHAGCPVCVEAEQQLIQVMDAEVKVVHLGLDPSQIAVAEKAGVKSVPALVMEGNVFHINFGASLEDLKGAAR